MEMLQPVSLSSRDQSASEIDTTPTDCSILSACQREQKRTVPVVLVTEGLRSVIQDHERPVVIFFL